ncbi:DUF5007 domain-containing protein [Pedobacter gandavensis]|uniref:DUF5007 domain-containing protein n=1 Tax=Pedobacter gandavensis TaxID=2679963 RepID=UPI002478FE3A|nr:DUF5007 domain-containing protein [Pedobacter gandavensis]WGQ11278.1 DUF5007 domain-containing protein [Pedobacter gandavensis]
MKKYIYITMALMLSVVIWTGCKKITVGFLSDSVYYVNSPFQVEKGKNGFITSELKGDGSTAPLKIKLLQIKKKGTEQRADELYQEQKVYVYKTAFDPEVHTTLELLNSIRELKSKPLFEFLPSGQFLFTSGTSIIPKGAEYTFDIEVSNESGAKTFKNIGELDFVESQPFSINRNTATYLQDGGTVFESLPPVEITITRTSVTGTNVIVRYVDENGVPFNPKDGELIVRGDRPTLDSYAKFNPVLKTNTEMSLNFEIIPFPYKTITGYGSFDIFYRIPSDFVTVTNPKSSYPGNARFNINPAIGFQLKQEGNYVVEVKIKGVKHR